MFVASYWFPRLTLQLLGDRLCGQDDLSLYHTIVSQIRSAQDEGIKDTKWASWKDCYPP